MRSFEDLVHFNSSNWIDWQPWLKRRRQERYCEGAELSARQLAHPLTFAALWTPPKTDGSAVSTPHKEDTLSCQRAGDASPRQAPLVTRRSCTKRRQNKPHMLAHISVPFWFRDLTCKHANTLLTHLSPSTLFSSIYSIGFL